MRKKPARRRALGDARRRPLVATRELGVHGQELTRLVQSGALERVARGTYRIADAPITENHSLAVAATIAPASVICLLSSLAFHGIGTQVPFEVWVAIERGSRAPALRQPARIVRMSGRSFSAGIEVHSVEDVRVRIYGVAKTIADLFKFRNRIGIDVAVEALRDVWQRRLVTIAEIETYARICRVDRVMTPYIEALTA